MTPLLMGIDPQVIVVGLIIVFSLLGPLFERMMRRKARERGEKVEGPEPEEPKLPYEDLVDQLFGPYVERRKREYEAKRRGQAGESEIEVLEEAPEPRPRPVIRRTEPVRVAEPARAEEPQAHLAPIPRGGPAAKVAERPRLSLDEILFRNRRFSAGAKLLLASEILRRPRGMIK